MNNYNLLIISVLLSLAPFFLVLTTAYLKINIVLNLFKNAIGAQQVPSGVIIGTISLAISLMVMEPIWEKSNSQFLSNQIKVNTTQDLKISELIDMLYPIFAPWREFVEKHAGVAELEFLSNLQDESSGDENKVDQINETKSFIVILTAFILCEIKEAFQMGLMILLPFLIIDFLIANILAGLGMMMFSPILLSLPLKILLIVSLDFWQLIFKALYLSYY